MKRILIPACACILAIACSKKDSSPVAGGVSTKTELLTKADWFLKSEQYHKQSESTWTDNTAKRVDQWSQDDHLVFKKDGTYEVNEGATRYAPTDPFIIETGIWKSAQNETMLLITPTGGAQRDATIEVLDANTLTVSYAQLAQGTTYIFKDTYTH
jgi:hypothetical protein